MIVEGYTLHSFGYIIFLCLVSGLVMLLVDARIYKAEAAAKPYKVSRALGWVNYLFVWSAVHQLGYAWSDGELASARRTVPMFVVGLGLLVAYVAVALPYMRRREQTEAPGDLHLRQ